MIGSEYQALIAMTAFFTLAWVPVSAGKFSDHGVKWLWSNREGQPKGPSSPWVGRCERAHGNLKDYFPAFVVAILVLGATQKFDQSTACAAWIFVGARLVHYLAYGLGISAVRFLSFATGLLSNLYLLSKVLS